MSKKSLLVVHPSDEMYGADKVLLRALDALQDDWDIEVWLPTDVSYPRRLLGKALQERNLNVRYVDLPVLRRAYMNGRSLMGLIRRFWQTARLLITLRPDALYINTAALAPLAPFARALGIPVVLHLHEYLSGLQKLILKPMIAFSTTIICVSASVCDVLGDALRRKSTIIHNGFRLPNATSFDKDTGEDLRFLVASRWNSWKGHELLFAAWDKIERSDARLTVLGGPPPSGASVDVPKLVSALRRPDSVEILGETDDVHAKIRSSHVVIVPSTQPDPLPTIAIEAAAAGRIVIASASGGLPEIVIHGKTGWLFQQGNSDSLSSVIDQVDKSSLNEMGRSARDRYEECFEESRFGASIGEAFASLNIPQDRKHK